VTDSQRFGTRLVTDLQLLGTHFFQFVVSTLRKMRAVFRRKRELSLSIHMKSGKTAKKIVSLAVALDGVNLASASY
jgi:hypothetical protein